MKEHVVSLSNKEKDNVSDITVARKMVQLQGSANKRKIEFDLSFSTVKNLMLQKQCWFTGVEFDDDRESPESRSVDRLDSDKGYVEGNIVPCTVRINQLKSNASFEEIKMLYKKLKKARKQKVIKYEPPTEERSE